MLQNIQELSSIVFWPSITGDVILPIFMIACAYALKYWSKKETSNEINQVILCWGVSLPFRAMLMPELTDTALLGDLLSEVTLGLYSTLFAKAEMRPLGIILFVVATILHFYVLTVLSIYILNLLGVRRIHVPFFKERAYPTILISILITLAAAIGTKFHAPKTEFFLSLGVFAFCGAIFVLLVLLPRTAAAGPDLGILVVTAVAATFLILSNWDFVRTVPRTDSFVGLCVHPIPKQIKQSLDLLIEKPHLTDNILAEINLLRATHCRAVKLQPTPDYKEDLGDNCTMYSGILNNERVYWGVCNGSTR